MSHVLAIAKKEFRGFFSSPIAFLFLAVTLGAILINFFRIENFFANNLANVRPLFAVMPWVLVLLVSALTMRLWSEEQKGGTLEILMTLPIKNIHLVLGKFLAGWFLVVLALLFTLGIPLTVSLMGPLDWGPVWGGYFAALLLGGAYLAMGLCVSSLTDNQIVSLIFTLVLGFFLYAIGRDDIASYLGDGLANLVQIFLSTPTEVIARDIEDIFRAIGTTSHFKSIERGLFDSRDFFYFLGLIAFFLTLNGQIILGKRQLPRSSRSESNRSWLVLLVAINVILMNWWMAPKALFRLDLTQDKIFTLSPVTKELITSLDEEVVIQVVLSKESHPLLKPLVPQIKDLVSEYAHSSDGRLIAEFVDPTQDDQLASTLSQRYDVEPMPIPVLQKYRQEVNAVYFHVLVKYGDRFELLTLEKLIEHHQDPATQQIYVKFKNLEYDLTKTIKKVVHEFESLESAFSRFDGQAKVTVFFAQSSPIIAQSPDSQLLVNLASKTLEAAQEIEKISSGKFSYEQVDPLKLGKDFEALAQEEGLTIESILFSVRCDVNGKREIIQISQDMDTGGLRRTIESSLRRLMPGFSKTIGIWTGGKVTPDPRGYGPPQTEYMAVRQFLEQEYSVKEVVDDINNGLVPDDVDLLVVAGIEENISDQAKYAFDQYVMSGRPVIVYQGIADAEIDQYTAQLKFRPFRFGLEDLLFQYGVQVVNTFVQSTECYPFLSSFQQPSIQRRYFSFLDVRQENLDQEHPATAGLRQFMLPWCSPVRYNEKLPVKFTELVRTSDKSWRHEPKAVEDGNPSGAFEGSQLLSVSARGPAVSWFKGKDIPVDEDGQENSGDNKPDRARARIDKVDDVRIAVVGSHMAIKDTTYQLVGYANNFAQGLLNVYENSWNLLANLVNWCFEDTALARLRGRGHFARTLYPMEEKMMRQMEFLNYGVAVFLLVVVLVGHFVLKSTKKPMVTFEAGESS